MELVVAGEVVQLRLAHFQGADAAQKIGEHLLAVLVLAVTAPAGDVVDVAGQKEEVVGPLQLQAVDDLLIEGLARLPVLQPAVPQGGEQAVLLAVHDLLGGEDDVDEVFPQGPGQGLFQKA